MIGYIWKRFWRRYATTRVLANRQIAPGFYLLPGPTSDIDSATFELADSRFVHLGDQLFYEPAMRWLQAAGRPVSVAPTAPLAAYFNAIGIDVVPPSTEIPANTLRIVPLASYDTERHIARATLVVDFADPRISEPLCDALFAATAKILGIDASARTAIDRSADLKWPRLALALPDNAVLFSNYVDSGRFRIKKSFAVDFRRKALELKTQGHRIVHVGSARDQERDPAHYEFVDVDLRGKTTPVELIQCCHSPSVRGALTYDNFVMHTSLMAGKPTFVKFRGRYTEAARRHHYLHVNEALAARGSRLVTYI